MIILASASPRRKELLSTIVDNFKVEVSHIDEDKYLTDDPVKSVKTIAYQKGKKVHEKHNEDVVISSDTIVVIDNQIIGKPVDEEDAKRILRLLSGRTHIVYTAYAIFHHSVLIEGLVKSEVKFFDLDEYLIDEYVKSGSPMDKAGAYGVQDNASYRIIEEVHGSIHNVIGFPIEEIKADLLRYNLL